MTHADIFIQFAIILSLSSLFGYLVYRLKLPLVVAYLLAGVSISLVSSFDPQSSEIFSFLPEIGIAFVLFLIGMELDLREIRALGKPIFAAALGQILVTTLAGYAIAGLLGFDSVVSVYIGLGLAFSSTVVVIKMLLEKNELTSLYGKLSIGILLVEDLVAIAVLMLISVSSSAFNLGFQESLPVLALIAKALGLFLLTFVLSKYVLQRVFDAVAKSVELLFLTAVTWCFLFTTLAVVSGFSVVIGAFLAGVALASSPYHLQIQGKVKPLRDFFVTLFFVYLGMQAKLSDLITHWPAVIIFTAFAVLIKPLLYLLLLGMFGFRKHTMFQTALNLSQISEFSLVVLLVAVTMGTASPEVLSIMSAVAVISIVISSIMISDSRKIFRILSPFLTFFEHKAMTHVLECKLEDSLQDHVVLIGGHRIGGPVVKYLLTTKIPFLVLDFNPHVVEELTKKKVNVIYGDVGDPDIIDYLQIEKAKLIICTASDMHDTEILLDECRRRRVRAQIIVRAVDPEHAAALKALGADYIIFPDKVSGDYLVKELKSQWPNINFDDLK
jgi:Kef-type K+ transport system membrane component KefB